MTTRPPRNTRTGRSGARPGGGQPRQPQTPGAQPMAGTTGEQPRPGQGGEPRMGSATVTRPVRPTRESVGQSRRTREAQRRAVAQRRQRITLIASGVILLIAIGIIVRALTASSSDGVAKAVTVTGGHPTVSKVSQQYVAGAPINGISCLGQEQLVYHIHAQLVIDVKGTRYYPPHYVGIIQKSNCLYWIHMHADYPGVIHLESPIQATYTLGDFLAIWSVTPDPNYGTNMEHALLQRVETENPSVVSVNGKPYSGDIRKIPLNPYTEITLGYGETSVVQQPFDFSVLSSGAMPTVPPQ